MKKIVTVMLNTKTFEVIMSNHSRRYCRKHYMIGKPRDWKFMTEAQFNK